MNEPHTANVLSSAVTNLLSAHPTSPFMNALNRLVLPALAILLCSGDNTLGQGRDATKEETKLPGSTKGLGQYLVNTVWDLEGGKVFRFRGDGTMVMPWHDFEWKPTGKRTAQMFTRDWRWEIVFSEDMTTCEVPGRYKGKMSRRIEVPLDDKKLQEILTASPWTRVAKSEREGFSFAKSGKILDAGKVWKSWELHSGILVLKGMRNEKEVRDEFCLQADKKPYVFVSPEGGDRPKLEQD